MQNIAYLALYVFYFMSFEIKKSILTYRESQEIKILTGSGIKFIWGVQNKEFLVMIGEVILFSIDTIETPNF